MTVVCGTPAFRGETQTTLRNPTVVCEVLAPATAAYDRGEKFALYRGVASIQAVVYLDPDARTVEVRRRTETTWAIEGPTTEGPVALDALGVSLDPAALCRP